MEIEEAYKVMQAACGIKKGDTVRVLRSFKSYELGCGDSWNPDMGGSVGEEFVVKEITGTNCSIGDYYWPFFCLEKIKSATHTIAFDGSEPVEVPDDVWKEIKKAMN